MKKSLLGLIATGLLFTACENGDKEFPDYKYQTIYFSMQSPVRTITLGDDGDYNTDLDNLHQCEIKATVGGVNTNKKTRKAKFVVDNSMVDRIEFADGRPVKAMPASYYSLSGDEMVIPSGKVLGGVKVQLTDAFFNDPEAIDVNYVIPLVLTESADSILQGKAKDGVTNPDRLNVNDWVSGKTPKDYTFYAVKYKNPYHGVWLSKGTDKIENNGEVKTVDRMAQYWEKATLRELATKSLTKSVYKFSHVVPVVNADGTSGETTLNCELILDIDDQGQCTVSTSTPGCRASGNGSWTRKGEPKAWGDKDRDLLKLNYEYEIDYVVNAATGATTTYKVTTAENMVMRDRQNSREEFSFKLK